MQRHAYPSAFDDHLSRIDDFFDDGKMFRQTRPMPTSCPGRRLCRGHRRQGLHTGRQRTFSAPALTLGGTAAVVPRIDLIALLPKYAPG